MKKAFTFFCMAVTVLVIGILIWLNAEEDSLPDRLAETKEELIRNVYITGTKEGSLCFYDGSFREAALGDDSFFVKAEAVADITLKTGTVADIRYKEEFRIRDKVLSLEEGGITLENYGKLSFAEDCIFLNLCGEWAPASAQDIKIGYDFSDFIVEDGEVTAVLNLRRESITNIRVLLKNDDFAGDFHKEVLISCDTDYIVKTGEGENAKEEYKKAGEEICLARNGVLEEGLGERVCVVPVYREGRITVKSLNRAQGHPAYAGSIEATAKREGVLLINEVNLEDYLCGVLPSEMPTDYPIEALKAQAVCARTYAYFHILHPGIPAYGAHVDDSTGYQVYQNTKESPACSQAVAESCGEILADDGESISAYYYSTSCGIGTDERTFNPGMEDMDAHLIPQRIGSAGNAETDFFKEEDFIRAFLKNKDEKDYEWEEPWYRWTVTLSFPEDSVLLSRLKERYRINPGHIQMAEGDGYSSKEVEKLGKVINISVLKRGEGGIAEEILIEGEKASYKVISQSDIRYVLCDGNTKAFKQDGSEYVCKTLLPSAFFFAEKEEKDGKAFFILYGGGFGHGAGMSQNAAKNMAAQGMCAEEILQFFYKNCEIVKVGEY